MRTLFAISCLTSALLLSASGYACEGGNVVFEDQFKDDSGGWEPTPDVNYSPAGLSADIGSDYTSLTKLNPVFAVGDADICVDAAFPTKRESTPYVGLVFWALDYDNFYLFQVTQEGKAQIWRMNATKWVKVFESDFAAIKKEPGASNHLRVTTKGNSFTAYVNGEKFREQKAQAPKADAMFGFYMQIDAKTPAADARTFLVTNYKVTDLP